MILDGILLILLAIAAFLGRKTGAFRMGMRLAAVAISWISTALWGGKLQAFFQTTGVYKALYEKILSAVQNPKAAEPGAMSFWGAAQGQAAETIAKSLADSASVAASFVGIWILVRLVIWILDKTVLHLPLIRPVNAFLGIAVSLFITLAVLYALVGAIGGTLLCTENEFWRQQMEASVLVRGMYENNLVMNWLFKKG